MIKQVVRHKAAQASACVSQWESNELLKPDELDTLVEKLADHEKRHVTVKCFIIVT